MHIMMALLSALAHSCGSVSLRTYQTKYQVSLADLRLYQCARALLTGIGNLILAGFCLRLDSTGLALALCYGLDLTLTSILTARCYTYGPMSVTSVITNACVVMPIALGCLVYGETMTPTRILGFVFLAGCFLLSAVNPGEKKKKDTQPIWYLLVFLAFFCNGMGAVLLNIYGRVAGSGERNSFLAIGYLVSGLLFLPGHFKAAKENSPVDPKQFLKPMVALLVVVGSMGGFIGNGLLMSLNLSMPASVLYPLVNGGIAVIVAIISCIVFKEKLTLQRFFTILLGLAAIVTLNL